MLRGLLGGIAELIYPKVCLSCRRSLKGVSSVDGLVCAECFQGIKRTTPPFCSSCGRHLDKNHLHGRLCGHCLRSRQDFDRAYAPCAYDGTVKELIHQFKYRQKTHLGKPLARLMIEFAKDYRLPIENMDALIPMPLSAARLREREFNQAQVLGQHLEQEFTTPLFTDCLVRTRHTQSQTSLDNEKRLSNVAGSFAVKNHQLIKSKNILLIDDVLTTGASSSHAAKALKDAGAHIVFVLTVAN